MAENVKRLTLPSRRRTVPGWILFLFRVGSSSGIATGFGLGLLAAVTPSPIDRASLIAAAGVVILWTIHIGRRAARLEAGLTEIAIVGNGVEWTDGGAAGGPIPIADIAKVLVVRRLIIRRLARLVVRCKNGRSKTLAADYLPEDLVPVAIQLGRRIDAKPSPERGTVPDEPPVPAEIPVAASPGEALRILDAGASSCRWTAGGHELEIAVARQGRRVDAVMTMSPPPPIPAAVLLERAGSRRLSARLDETHLRIAPRRHLSSPDDLREFLRHALAVAWMRGVEGLQL